MKRAVVISLGGSLIIPDKIDYKFLEHFKKTVRAHYRKHKFVAVCGGGSVARKYIKALQAEDKNKKEISLAGIRITRMNAQFMMQFFGKDANETVPIDMNGVKNQLKKNNIVFCGALRYANHETSDGTAAKLANYLKTPFINLTNVQGLYTDNPKTNKSAKFIPKISWKDFQKIALKINYKPGQHFVLDQEASKIIKKHKIVTYILGPDLKNFDNLLRGKSFVGTTIRG